ncbi:MAG: hypothetical protein Q7U74_13115, partial [Saprospiraceae bacterium]|nr:hypothetical protein [Saprospiraceae bacterium]
MKTYRATAGPFAERPFFKTDEVEQICTDELCKMGLMPASPGKVRVERFIEKKFNVAVAYEELPPGVLGLIEFGPNGVRRLAISEALVEDSSRVAERRINTTLAHETGHGLLHTHLFIFGEKPAPLFRGDQYPNEPGILCRGDGIQGIPGQRRKRYEWW